MRMNLVHYWLVVWVIFITIPNTVQYQHYHEQKREITNSATATVKAMAFKAWKNIGPLENPSNIIETITTLSATIGSATVCGKHCLKTPNCCGFYFKIHDFCQLVDTPRRILTSVVKNGINYYELISQCTKNRTLCGTGECVPHFHNDSYTCVFPMKLPKTGSATQISGNAPASLAVDDEYGQKYSVGGIAKCSHTRVYEGEYVWWQFTFQKEVLLEKLEIYNRKDCCGFRINDALVEVYGDSPTSAGQTCGRVDSSNDPVRWVVCSSLLRGRTVRITSVLTEPLTICEVDFYGVI